MLTKRATQRVLFAMVMIAMLMATTSLMAEPEAGGGEDPDGWCSMAGQICFNQCFNSWFGCRGMNQNPDLCQDQYDWCMEDCMGDFWCGYRQF